MQLKSVWTVLALPVLLAFAPPAMAQSAAQCAVIAADTDRLLCYDTLFRTADGQAVPAADAVTLASENLIPARPSGRAAAEITVACDTGNLSVAFAFAGNTMSSLGRDTGLTLQADLQRARSQTLPVDPSNTKVLINNRSDAIAFIESLRGVQNLTVRVTPATTRSLNVRFRLGSFVEDVAPVISACAQ